MNEDMLKMMQLQDEISNIRRSINPGVYDESNPQKFQRLRELEPQLNALNYKSKSVNSAADLRSQLSNTDVELSKPLADLRVRQAQGEFSRANQMSSQLPPKTDINSVMGSDYSVPRIKEGMNSELIDDAYRRGQTYIDALKDKGFNMEPKRNYSSLTEQEAPYLTRFNYVNPDTNIKIRGSSTVDALGDAALLEAGAKAASVPEASAAELPSNIQAQKDAYNKAYIQKKFGQ